VVRRGPVTTTCWASGREAISPSQPAPKRQVNRISFSGDYSVHARHTRAMLGSLIQLHPSDCPGRFSLGDTSWRSWGSQVKPAPIPLDSATLLRKTSEESPPLRLLRGALDDCTMADLLKPWRGCARPCQRPNCLALALPVKHQQRPCSSWAWHFFRRLSPSALHAQPVTFVAIRLALPGGPCSTPRAIRTRRTIIDQRGGS